MTDSSSCGSGRRLKMENGLNQKWVNEMIQAQSSKSTEVSAPKNEYPVYDNKEDVNVLLKEDSTKAQEVINTVRNINDQNTWSLAEAYALVIQESYDPRNFGKVFPRFKKEVEKLKERFNRESFNKQLEAA
jgi:hypothetical protein